MAEFPAATRRRPIDGCQQVRHLGGREVLRHVHQAPAPDGRDGGGQIAIKVPGLPQKSKEAAERRHLRTAARLGGDMPDQVPGHVVRLQIAQDDRSIAEALDQKAPEDEPVSSGGGRRERPVVLQVGCVPRFDLGHRRPVHQGSGHRNEVGGLEIGEKQPERGGVTLTARDGTVTTTEVVRVTSTEVPDRPPASVEPPPKRGQGPHVLSDRRPRIPTLGQPRGEPIEMRSDRIGPQSLCSGAVS